MAEQEASNDCKCDVPAYTCPRCGTVAAVKVTAVSPAGGRGRTYFQDAELTCGCAGEFDVRVFGRMGLFLCHKKRGTLLRVTPPECDAPVKLVKLELSHAEVATVLAALHLYRRRGLGEPCWRTDEEHDIATGGTIEWECVSLPPDDVSRLSEKIVEAARTLP
jgi:hypothetical protein